ncbi:type II toxin-antitoxin system VapC family toxin [Acinetobacter sp. c3-l95]|uniref:type II toxin-antitoxin system VapC family toxin n=1 Tax=Acinetobacter sp. c3-l95 TaxID=3342804 RepID=UPI0035BB12F1
MYLIDTNIIIYYLNGDKQARHFLNENHGHLAISTITVLEVLSFGNDENAVTIAESFLQNNFTWLDVSRDIVFESAKIRRQKKTKTPDAIIGATAVCHNLTLVSRNEKDFQHLPCKLINPID